MLPKFVEAGDIEDARQKLHAFIDERLDHELHMIGIEKVVEKTQQKREAYKAAPKVADSDITQLTIGEFVNEDPKAKGNDTDGLLDLESLL